MIRRIRLAILRWKRSLLVNELHDTFTEFMQVSIAGDPLAAYSLEMDIDALHAELGKVDWRINELQPEGNSHGF